MLYWFHLKLHLSKRAQWPTFVQRRPAACYVIDLPSAEAARDVQHCHRWFVLRYGTASTATWPGTPTVIPRRCRRVFGSGGVCGATTCRVVATWYTHTTHT